MRHTNITGATLQESEKPETHKHYRNQKNQIIGGLSDTKTP